MELPSEQRKRAIQRKLIDWFKENKRDLPWRRNRNAYKVWVSEMMLQQTQVDTVVPYYERFMEQFPTIEALSEAEEEDVLKVWEGLGYYSRARHLHRAAREVVTKYGGVVPDNREDMMRLKGVGSYTAGAILSLAFGKPEPAVDGNVMRVLARLFALEDDISKAATKTKMEYLAKHLIPEGEAARFNEGLIELGALVCTPRAPACLICPLISECRGRAKGIHEALPVKKQKPRMRTVRLVCGVVEKDGAVLIRRRPETGLLAGMWEFPNIEGATTGNLLTELDVEWGPYIGDVDHTFSHVKWQIQVYVGRLKTNVAPLRPTDRFVVSDNLSAYVFPKVFHNVWTLKSQWEKNLTGRQPCDSQEVAFSRMKETKKEN